MSPEKGWTECDPTVKVGRHGWDMTVPLRVLTSVEDVKGYFSSHSSREWKVGRGLGRLRAEVGHGPKGRSPPTPPS